MNTCMICLERREILIEIGNENSVEICLKSKLEKIIPEIEWRSDYRICANCSEQISNSYSFREICLNSEDLRWKLWNEINSKSVKNPDEIKSETYECKEEPEDYACLNSDETFQDVPSISQLDEDLNPLKEFCCKCCGKQYSNKNLCDEHEKSCFPTVNKNELNERTDLDTELKHDDIREKIVEQNKCDTCKTSFKNKYLLKRHKKTVHATEKSFKCDQCSSTFVSSVYLNAHKKYHSGLRTHVCSFCGKRFVTASDLYHHEQIHGNKRAYKCPDCVRAFNTSSDLHRHQLCVHLDKNFWKYSCEHCTRKFPMKTNLYAHLRTHTGEKNVPCHLCNKKVHSKSALTQHLLSHTNIKSFKCIHCNADYERQKSLDIHMKRSHGAGDVKLPEND